MDVHHGKQGKTLNNLAAIHTTGSNIVYRISNFRPKFWALLFNGVSVKCGNVPVAVACKVSSTDETNGSGAFKQALKVIKKH